MCPPCVDPIGHPTSTIARERLTSGGQKDKNFKDSGVAPRERVGGRDRPRPRPRSVGVTEGSEVHAVGPPDTEREKGGPHGVAPEGRRSVERTEGLPVTSRVATEPEGTGAGRRPLGPASPVDRDCREGPDDSGERTLAASPSYSCISTPSRAPSSHPSPSRTGFRGPVPRPVHSASPSFLAPSVLFKRKNKGLR